MYIKTYHFRLKPGSSDAVVELQKEVDAFYHRFVECETEFLQDGKDPDQWVEIQYFASRQAYLDGQKRMNAEFPVRPFHRKLHDLLDPQNPEVSEEEYEDPR